MHGQATLQYTFDEVKANLLLFAVHCSLWLLAMFLRADPYKSGYIHCLLIPAIVFCTAIIPSGFIYWSRVYKPNRKRIFTVSFLALQVAISGCLMLIANWKNIFATRSELCDSNGYFGSMPNDIREILGEDSNLKGGPSNAAVANAREALLLEMKRRFHIKRPEAKLCISYSISDPTDTVINGKRMTWKIGYQYSFNDERRYRYAAYCNDDTCIPMR